MSTWGLDCVECSFDPGVALCVMFAAETFSFSNSPALALAEIPEIDEGCL